MGNQTCCRRKKKKDSKAQGSRDVLKLEKLLTMLNMKLEQKIDTSQKQSMKASQLSIYYKSRENSTKAKLNRSLSTGSIQKAYLCKVYREVIVKMQGHLGEHQKEEDYQQAVSEKIIPGMKEFYAGNSGKQRLKRSSVLGQHGKQDNAEHNTEKSENNNNKKNESDNNNENENNNNNDNFEKSNAMSRLRSQISKSPKNGKAGGMNMMLISKHLIRLYKKTFPVNFKWSKSSRDVFSSRQTTAESESYPSRRSNKVPNKTYPRDPRLKMPNKVKVVEIEVEEEAFGGYQITEAGPNGENGRAEKVDSGSNREREKLTAKKTENIFFKKASEFEEGSELKSGKGKT